MRNDEVDFTILRKPYAVWLVCPHCDYHVEIPWRDVDEPEYWGDDWGYVTCPDCHKELKLGDYDVD